jgi:Resolvase, N terminal domain
MAWQAWRGLVRRGGAWQAWLGDGKGRQSRRLFHFLAKQGLPAMAEKALAYISLPQGTEAECRESVRFQIEAIETFASQTSTEILGWYEDPVDGVERPGLRRMLAMIKAGGEGVSTIVVATATDFSPNPLVQDLGYALLRAVQISLVATDGTFHENKTAIEIIRQVLPPLLMPKTEALEQAQSSRQVTPQSTSRSLSPAEVDALIGSRK